MKKVSVNGILKEWGLKEEVNNKLLVHVNVDKAVNALRGLEKMIEKGFWNGSNDQLDIIENIIKNLRDIVIEEKAKAWYRREG